MSKKYTEEFKSMIVELYKSGKAPTEIMREYGLSSSTFYKWTNAKAELAVDGDTVTAEEVKQLKKQLAILATENEILKKAMAIFASTQEPR
ncbi:hypothetical protein SCACP_37600 [Sporomusa carbonis]|uniref:transposase n=1 Tax=Sporomusa carbonis TaxID=3076075 RepID=UPI003A7569EF